MKSTASKPLAREPYCILRVTGRGWAQESYETASRDAGRRARELRKLGYRVSVSALGSQVTDMGRIVLTMVTIDNTDAAPETPPFPKEAAR